MANRNRAEVRTAVHGRIRRKVRGTTERPRLAVYRSLNHIYAQLIDDEKAQTIASASTTEKSLGVKSGGNIDAAKKIGQTIAERALAAGVESVVFDRGGYLYHGRVKALTDAARAAGLNKDEVVETEAAAEPASAPAAEEAPAKPKKEKKEKKAAAPKDAGTGETSAEPKARKPAAPKEAKDAEAGSPPEKAGNGDSDSETAKAKEE
jgi:large subunit ribosomal protein L18